MYYNTITILQYPSIYVETVPKPLYSAPFFLSLHYISKLSWQVINLPKCHALAMTCLQKSKNEAYSMNPMNLIG
jgi:hypothetical protein